MGFRDRWEDMKRTLMFCILLLFLIGGDAMAQVQTITAMVQQSRSGGTYNTPVWLVPDRIAVTGEVFLSLNMQLSALQNESNTVQIDLFKSDTGVAPWRHVTGSNWNGGDYLDRFGNIIKGPSIGLKIDELIGKYLRLRIITNRPFVWGIDLDIW